MPKNLRPVALLAGLTLTMTACGGSRSPEWYAEHPDKAQEKLAWCEEQAQQGKINKGGTDSAAQDCRNAAQALMRKAAEQASGR
ncbi:EexN family lipoprotein [Pseudoxanthomonas kaohsiungensis]|uniref:EexN family lipoprotein n=1 Tax=Pseudoxanthomonas kaohsiungensis TaxID=283923 RepID=A0ABW3LXH5_9GAMM|nr:EexN family lipoprotein [Pseudoxanthomonas kaohsiungensis]KAF1702912.1 hypothetical protein CSC66_09055 [Pseudoxanthomonas kaohsiungensis]